MLISRRPGVTSPERTGFAGRRSNLGDVQVIVTHANTDFDAFAAMLAARRLYPDAVIALSGSLNRNVRDFYRLHAEELECAEPGRVDPGAVERLIVVETSHPARLGEFEAAARSPEVEVVVFDHHAGEELDWVSPRTSCAPRTEP